jgi:hypothetical protein
MRVRLNVAVAAAVAIAACAGCSDKSALSQAEASTASQGEMVTAVGCPVAGPQPGCVTITEKGTVYDLSGASPAVDLSKGKGVSLTGHAGEATSCGVKLSDVQFDYLGLQCGAPAPPA